MNGTTGSHCPPQQRPRRQAGLLGLCPAGILTEGGIAAHVHSQGR